MLLILPEKGRMNQRLHINIVDHHKQLKLYNSQTVYVHITFMLLHQAMSQIFCNLSKHCLLLYIFCYCSTNYLPIAVSIYGVVSKQEDRIFYFRFC